MCTLGRQGAWKSLVTVATWPSMQRSMRREAHSAHARWAESAIRDRLLAKANSACSRASRPLRSRTLETDAKAKHPRGRTQLDKLWKAALSSSGNMTVNGSASEPLVPTVDAVMDGVLQKAPGGSEIPLDMARHAAWCSSACAIVAASANDPSYLELLARALFGIRFDRDALEARPHE